MPAVSHWCVPGQLLGWMHPHTLAHLSRRRQSTVWKDRHWLVSDVWETVALLHMDRDGHAADVDLAKKEIDDCC